MFYKSQTDAQFKGTNKFLLMTRYRLQAEVKAIFDTLKERIDAPVAMPIPGRTTSSLFPQISVDDLKSLTVQYLEDKGKKRRIENHWRNDGETIDDCVSRLIRRLSMTQGRRSPVTAVFETMIIDEAHLLKKRPTYWGIGAALVAVHSSRRIPVTGTPYINGTEDLATMMTFIDAAKLCE